MSAPKFKALTYRVEGIPYGTTPSQLIREYFSAEDHEYLTVRSLCPSVESIEDEEENGDLTATVFFRPRVPQPDGPRIQDNAIQVGRDFTGFTPLYVPSAAKGPIAAEYVYSEACFFLFPNENLHEAVS